MRRPLFFIIAAMGLALPIAALPAFSQSQSSPQSSHTSPDLSSIPLADRVGPAPKAFFDMLQLTGAHSIELTAADRQQVAAAFDYLTPLQKEILKRYLNQISFVEGMPNSALTYPNPDDPTKQTEDVTIRAGVLHETVSQMLTNKEASCFDTKGSNLSVAIDGGTMPALVYVLLHEATHIVDHSLGLTSDYKSAPSVEGKNLTSGVWASRLENVPAYRIPILEQSCYRQHGAVLPVAKAEQVYQALAQTPFASLYGSNNWHDDIAELVAWYDLTHLLHQPYRYTVLENGKEIYSYEPMGSPLVKKRLAGIAFFYDAKPPAS